MAGKFYDENFGIALVAYITDIFITTNGGLTFTENEVNNNLLNNYQLLQNFPNPLNPSTTISYSIPKTENVTLKIYDILGNEVRILVDEYKSAGKYEIKFDASSLSSGIYFYKIITDNFVETKKMVLLK